MKHRRGPCSPAVLAGRAHFTPTPIRMNPSPATLARLTSAVAALLLFSPAAAAPGAVTPSGLFQDGAVLQRDMKVPVWGKAQPGEKVTVAFAGQSKTASAGPDGKWTVALDPLPADATPHDLVISGSNTVTVKNVLVGEVWLASGQSNMGVSLNEAAQSAQEIAAADYPLLRVFTVPHEGSLTPLDEVHGAWKICTPANAGQFSAVGFFFAREILQALKIPIGVIHTSYGGTPAEAWTSREALNSVPDFKRVADGQIATIQAAPADLAAFPTALPAWEEKYGVKDGENAGVRQGWAVPGTDTPDWKKVDVGFTWAQALGAKGGGVFWLRKEVDLPASAAGKPFQLNLGYLTETYHTAYFNGEEVGSMGRQPPDFYTGGRATNIPGKLVKAGRNVIALRLVTHTEKGGFFVPGKAMQLPVEDRNSIDNHWLIKAEKEFPPLPASALESRPKLNTAKLQYTSTALYNGMIHPLIPFAFRGVIWYQGEANVGPAATNTYYARLLPLMINDWRGRWQEGDFPFYLVQLANYSDVNRTHQPNGWPYLRESQTLIARTVPKCGMAVAIDVGSAVTIHPTDKQDVGKRLAALALAKDYGRRDVPFLSPLYRSHTVEGDKIRVTFEPGSGALMVGEKQGLEPAREAPGGKLAWFEIAGEDKKFTWAEARIDGDGVVVSSPEVPKPVAVRYAWAGNPEGCNLYNQAGLPASPFRTDDW